MFIGHYSVSFAAKSDKNNIPLWLLFIAVQLIDVLWSIFVFCGIERVRIVPGFTASNALDLYYMPYTHSLIGALGWSLLAYGLYRIWKGSGQSRTAAVIVGLAVFSHWILDLIVHTHDLSLYDDTMKVGFGLWNYRNAEFGLEVALLLGGMVLYFRNNAGLSPFQRYGTIGLVVFMILIQSVNTFASLPLSTDTSVAVSAFVLYMLFAGLAFLVEQRKTVTT